MSDVMFFENEQLDVGDPVKVLFDNGYYIGKVISRYEWFAQNQIFCTVKIDRMVVNGSIKPSDKQEIYRVPAWQGILKKISH